MRCKPYLIVLSGNKHALKKKLSAGKYVKDIERA